VSQPTSSGHPPRRLSGVDIEQVARHMFERQAVTYEADPAMVQLAWLDDDIRAFWVAEATSVIVCIETLAA
jgi:hypothetical protein